MDSKITEQARYWATSQAFDTETHTEIQNLLDAGDEKQLTDRFYRNLEFGTGGMRGIMGAGTAMMNIYNIRKASNALCQHIIAENSGKSNLRVAISHDSRTRGREFAEATAEVCAAYGIKALITKQMRPVPMLSFMVRHFQCDAGVCVTASHNPPEYNGYKAYWNTGGQLVPPHDKKIVARYDEISDYSSLKTMDYSEGLSKGLIEEIGEELDTPYFSQLQSLSMWPSTDDTAQLRQDFKVCYSPIHGTGIYAVPEALKRFGFSNIIIVPEQREPDGNFPTVKSPNPEDPTAMAMAVGLAKKERADLVIGTDPDTDRIAVIARESDTFVWFNGNQLGSLLIDYVLGALTRNGTMPKNAAIIKTIVTTELQDKIAGHYNVLSEDTLTGFKWICDQIENYESGKITPYRDFVCGGEESYGFLMGKFVRDKDAIIASAIATEMAAWHKSQGRTLTQALDEIFLRHGIYHEKLHTLTLPGKEGADKIQDIMRSLRGNPPITIGSNKVRSLVDIQSGRKKSVVDSAFEDDGKIDLPPSNVLQFFLDDGSKVSVRPSGTEPKIKFYISVCLSPNGLSSENIAEAKKRATSKADSIELDFVGLVQR